MEYAALRMGGTPRPEMRRDWEPGLSQLTGSGGGRKRLLSATRNLPAAMPKLA
jgi:hypothetical protein